MWTRASLIVAVTLLGVGVGVPTARADGLSGGERQDFVDGSISSCTAQNRNNPRNADYSDDDIHTYCVCYSNALADLVTHDDVQRLVQSQSTGIAWLMPKVNQANATCAADW